MADAVAGYLAQSGLKRRVEQARAITDWHRIVGPQIAAVTQPEGVTRDGILMVRVATAPWANELSMMTPRIIARINRDSSARINGIRWIPRP